MDVRVVSECFHRLSQQCTKDHCHLVEIQSCYLLSPHSLVDFSWVSAHWYGQTNDMYGQTEGRTWIKSFIWMIGKRENSAVCQQFRWVNGKADTALGIRDLPSAYLSITVFPFIYLTDTLHLLSVKLSLCSQGQQGTDGMVKERWDISGKFSNPVIR